MVKHKIECIRNSDGTFHFEAGAPVRQIGDRTIDQRVMTSEDDARSLESAVARFISALLLRVIHLLDLPATRHGAYAGSLAPNVPRQPGRRPLTGREPDQGLRLVDSRGRASHTATGAFAGPGEPSDCQLSFQGSKSSAWSATT